MTELETKMRALRDDGKKGIVPFISAGDPNLEVTRDVVLALSEAGATAIEIGVPFSDPIADGPTIQAASQRAIESGTTLSGILDMLEGVPAEQRAPLVIFSYLNPIDRLGFSAFASRSANAGASALLLTDATPGVEPDLEAELDKYNLNQICLVAPTTPDDRLVQIASRASGFIYMVARRGVTGAGQEQGEVSLHTERLRELTDVPLYVGFGIRTREDVDRISKFADGVVVGSALVTALHETPEAKRAQRAYDFLTDLHPG